MGIFQNFFCLFVSYCICTVLEHQEILWIIHWYKIVKCPQPSAILRMIYSVYVGSYFSWSDFKGGAYIFSYIGLTVLTLHFFFLCPVISEKAITAFSKIKKHFFKGVV